MEFITRTHQTLSKWANRQVNNSISPILVRHEQPLESLTEEELIILKNYNYDFKRSKKTGQPVGLNLAYGWKCLFIMEKGVWEYPDEFTSFCR